MTKRMKTVVLMVALLFLLGGTAAVAAVVWPASCTSDACVNSHLNNLNSRVKGLEKATISQPRLVTESYEFEENPAIIEQMVACGTPDPTDDRPFRGWAISGGLDIQGENAEQWHVFRSGPPNLMNSWQVGAYNPDYVPGDPLPTVTQWVLCLK